MSQHDSNTTAFSAKLSADDPRYKSVVAIPVMEAVDQMPREWRELVYEYGYVDVYRAWRCRWSAERVIAKAEANHGLFELC